LYTPCVLGAPYAVFFNKIAITYKKKKKKGMIEGYANLLGLVSSDPASASGSPSVVLLVISSPSSALSGSTAINFSSKEQLLGQSRRTQGYNKQQAVPGGHKSKEELLKSRQKVTVVEKKFAKNLSAAPGKKYANTAIAPSALSDRAREKVLEF
jgi:hypothetical protein